MNTLKTCLLSMMLILSLGFAATAQTAFVPTSDEQYRWLYEDLFSEQSRQELPNETFKSFSVHLKDSYQNFLKPDQLIAKNLVAVKKVQGTIAYVGIIKKKYLFDVVQTPEAIVLNVRVHLRNPTAQDAIDFAQKVQQAEDIWNQSRVLTDFNYKFKFEIVKQASEAHFSVLILDTTRGPYDISWGRDWTGHTVAHEIGHMLGLGDEYQTLSGTFDCYKPSIMCTAWTGSMMPHHYYFVIRRLFKTNGFYLN